MGKNPRRKRYRLLYALALLFLLGMIYSGYRIIHIEKEYGKSQAAYEELQAQFHADTAVSGSEAVNTITVDFDALRSVNPDAVAWITMAGTPIDYPVVQGDDNEYYLNHIFTKASAVAGCLFIDVKNAADFSDQNTIIYGHHMKNDSMFGSLDAFKEREYYEEHPSMTLYTPSGVHQVYWFAAYVIDSDSEKIPTCFSSSEAFTAYAEKAVERSYFRSDQEIAASDRILTLYTCAYPSKNARFVLQGVIR